MRSLWKGYFINLTSLNSLNNIILKNFINKNINIYNGKKISNILIKTNMLFLKIGALVFTRKILVNHKKKEIIKKKKKK
jgi:ribosomal protein S19